MADFNEAAVTTLLASLVSMARKLGPFKAVMTHEPKSPPSSFPALAIWWAGIRPARSSGLASVSGVVTFSMRVYQDSMLAEPQNAIDPGLLKNTCLVLKAIAGGFTLGMGGQVRDVDLLGAEGQALEARSGYITHDNRLLRVAEITVPVVVNDLWTEAP